MELRGFNLSTETPPEPLDQRVGAGHEVTSKRCRSGSAGPIGRQCQGIVRIPPQVLYRRLQGRWTTQAQVPQKRESTISPHEVLTEDGTLIFGATMPMRVRRTIGYRRSPRRLGYLGGSSSGTTRTRGLRCPDNSRGHSRRDRRSRLHDRGAAYSREDRGHGSKAEWFRRGVGSMKNSGHRLGASELLPRTPLKDIENPPQSRG